MALRATPFHQGKVVPAEHAGPELALCPVCGSVRPRTLIAAIQSEPRIDLARCEDCFACSATRQPAAEWLSDWYANYYAASDTGHTFHNASRLAAHIAHFGGRLVAGTEPLRLLDFGSGDGAVSVALAQRLGQGGRVPASVHLVDLHPVPVPAPAGVELSTGTDLKTAPMADVVVASAILEHLPHPEQTLVELLEHLRPGGIFYARTPFNAALARWMPGFDLGYPGHLHDLGPDWWNSVAGRRGLPVRVVRSAPSIVETTLRQAPIRTVLAHALKLPARAQAQWRGVVSGGWWPVCGGWEVVWQRV
jgi:SAM-dependent methyltransferase